MREKLEGGMREKVEVMCRMLGLSRGGEGGGMREKVEV